MNEDRIPLSTDWIKTRKDFVKFMEMMSGAYKNNGMNWENDNLDLYLSAMASYSDDVAGYYENTNQGDADSPTWKLFADIVIGASMYE